MKPELIRVNTILVRRPSVIGRDGRERLVPLICFSGLCLSDYGFEVGRRFEVYAQKGRLVLKAKEFKYENPIIKEEVK
jgi:hypothetical protein